MRIIGTNISSVVQPELTLVTSGYVASSVVTIPAHEVGDLMVVWSGARSSTGATPSLITVSGWTRVVAAAGSGTAQGVGAAVYYQIATGTASFSFTGINSNTDFITYAIFRPNYLISNITWTTDFQGYTSGAPPTCTCSSNLGIGSILGLAQVASVNTGLTMSNSGWTGQLSSDLRQRAFYKLITPANVPTNATISGITSGGQYVYEGGWLLIY